jgi:plastocyanin
MRNAFLKLAAGVALAGAAGSLLQAQAQAQAAGHEYTVVMDNMNFGALPSGAKVGDTIVWDNRDTVQHSATARDGSFDVRVNPGKKGRTRLTKAGTIALYCIFHPMMRGTLRVAPAG